MKQIQIPFVGTFKGMDVTDILDIRPLMKLTILAKIVIKGDNHTDMYKWVKAPNRDNTFILLHWIVLANDSTFELVRVYSIDRKEIDSLNSKRTLNCISKLKSIFTN